MRCRLRHEQTRGQNLQRWGLACDRLHLVHRKSLDHLKYIGAWKRKKRSRRSGNRWSLRAARVWKVMGAVLLLGRVMALILPSSRHADQVLVESTAAEMTSAHSRNLCRQLQRGRVSMTLMGWQLVQIQLLLLVLRLVICSRPRHRKTTLRQRLRYQQQCLRCRHRTTLQTQTQMRTEPQCRNHRIDDTR